MARFPSSPNMEVTQANPAIQVGRVPATAANIQALIAEKLERARQASQVGDRQRAYELTQEATQLAPDNAEAWLYSAAFAQTYPDRLACLNKALSLAPGHSQAWNDLYETLKHYMRHDPVLRYLEEDEGLYRVLTGNGYVVTVPKDRNSSSPYPPTEPSPLQPAFRWLRYALFGLPLAGIITVLCAPVAVVLAWRASRHRLDSHHQRRAQIVFLYGSILWAMGLLLSMLLWLHL